MKAVKHQVMQDKAEDTNAAASSVERAALQGLLVLAHVTSLSWSPQGTL